MIPSQRRKGGPVTPPVVSALAALLGLAVVVGAGCEQGREGDRCNPLLDHDECGGGLSCVMPFTCVESYCCPKDLLGSASGFCNGSSCPPGASKGDGGPGGDGAAE